MPQTALLFAMAENLYSVIRADSRFASLPPTRQRTGTLSARPKRKTERSAPQEFAHGRPRRFGPLRLPSVFILLVVFPLGSIRHERRLASGGRAHPALRAGLDSLANCNLEIGLRLAARHGPPRRANQRLPVDAEWLDWSPAHSPIISAGRRTFDPEGRP
jgi:hypothetical protein